MRVLVTGSQGQVVQSLCALRAPHQIIAIGRPELDIAAIDAVRTQVRSTAPAVVVNAAAYTAVDKAEADADAAMRVNGDGASNVAAVCAEVGIPIVHISTDYVFDGSKPGAYVETDTTAPLGVYGRTKLAGEKMVAAANPQHLILRTAWVYSPYGNNFVKTMLRLAATRPELGVVDDQYGSPTYAPHLAEAIVAILEQIERQPHAVDWGIYNAAGAGETTWCGLAREVFQVSQEVGGPSAIISAITTADYPTPARRPANSRLDGGKLKSVFGIELPHWTEGVGACVSALLAPRQNS